MANDSRTQEILIGHTKGVLPAGIAPMNMDHLASRIEASAISGVRVLRALRAPPTTNEFEAQSVFGSVPTESRTILVAEASDVQIEVLRKQPHLEIEPNLPLSLPESTGPFFNPSAQRPAGTGFVAEIRVTSASGGAPLPDAEVYVFGNVQSQGVTAADGTIRLTLVGETVDSINQLYVKPRFDHWDRLVARPNLAENVRYEISLDSLSTSFPGFPATPIDGWGMSAIKLDQLASQGNGSGQLYNGQGIKVAIIDSGAATTHQDLVGQIVKGFDVVGQSATGWNNDIISHGTHCAGVIAGLDGATGIRGIAPMAQVLVFKIFPGGKFDLLIDAIDKCIQEGVDVVNMSLGAGTSSVWIEERLQLAKSRGVACIVAAGNSAGPVQFPASSPHVLSVAAIGKTNTFPSSSYHAQQPLDQPDGNGFFVARFSCFGPKVDVCAPGVAVLSSVPPNNYAAWDGTSMAAPHVTGTAALILAHHPDFQKSPFKDRNAQRVDRLFQILKQTAQPLNLGGSQRTGSGLIDALAAFNRPVTAQPASGSNQGLQDLFAAWPL